MNREGSYLGSLLLPLVVLGIAGLFFFLSFDFPDQGEEVGAGSVPQLWMLCTAVLCVVLIINALLKRDSNTKLWDRTCTDFFALIGEIKRKEKKEARDSEHNKG
jgi:hypothetical protein